MHTDIHKVSQYRLLALTASSPCALTGNYHLFAPRKPRPDCCNLPLEMQFAVLAMTHMCIPKPSHPEAEGGWKKVARGEKKRRWGEKQMVRWLKPKGSRGLKRKVWGKGGEKGQGFKKQFFLGEPDNKQPLLH